MRKSQNVGGKSDRSENTKAGLSNGRRVANGTEDSEKTENPLREVLIDEIADVYSAEQQLLKALPKMAKAAQSEELREAFESHLEETQQQAKRLEEAMASLDETMKSKKCKAMEGLLEEGAEMMEEHKGEPTIDAVLIAAAQKVEHYEIASYGTLCAWAQQLGEDEAGELFTESLEEEKAADEKLTGIAEATANARAEQE